MCTTNEEREKQKCAHFFFLLSFNRIVAKTMKRCYNEFMQKKYVVLNRIKARIFRYNNTYSISGSILVSCFKKMLSIHRNSFELNAVLLFVRTQGRAWIWFGWTFWHQTLRIQLGSKGARTKQQPFSFKYTWNIIFFCCWCIFSHFSCNYANLFHFIGEYGWSITNSKKVLWRWRMNC